MFKQISTRSFASLSNVFNHTVVQKSLLNQVKVTRFTAYNNQNMRAFVVNARFFNTEKPFYKLPEQSKSFRTWPVFLISAASLVTTSKESNEESLGVTVPVKSDAIANLQSNQFPLIAIVDMDDQQYQQLMSSYYDILSENSWKFPDTYDSFTLSTTFRQFVLDSGGLCGVCDKYLKSFTTDELNVFRKQALNTQYRYTKFITDREFIFNSIDDCNNLSQTHLDGSEIKVSWPASETSNFIAMQAPLPNQMEKYFSYIYNNKITKIFHLTALEEIKHGRVRPKSDAYWDLKIGEYSMAVNQEIVFQLDQKDQVVIHRQLCLTNHTTGMNQIIDHYQTPNWPDQTTLSPQAIIALSQFLPQQTKNKIIIHCSAGLGRTGVLLLFHIIDRIITEQIQQGISLDEIQINPVDIAYRLRLNRVGLILFESQFVGAMDAIRLKLLSGGYGEING